MALLRVDRPGCPASSLPREPAAGVAEAMMSILAPQRTRPAAAASGDATLSLGGPVRRAWSLGPLGYARWFDPRGHPHDSCTRSGFLGVLPPVGGGQHCGFRIG